MYKAVGYRFWVKPDDVQEKIEEDVPEFLKEKGFKRALDKRQEQMEKHTVMSGTVISVGDECWKAFHKGPLETFKPWAKVGDRVTWAMYAGVLVDNPNNPDEEIFILNDEDLHSVYED